MDEPTQINTMEESKSKQQLIHSSVGMYYFNSIVVSDPVWQKEGITGISGKWTYEIKAVTRDGTELLPISKRYTEIVDLYSKLC